MLYERNCHFPNYVALAFCKKRAAHTKCDLWVWDVFPTSRCRNCAGPVLYTACKVLNSHPVMLANLQNLYVQALLAKYQIIQVCIACQVVNMDGNALLAKY